MNKTLLLLFLVFNLTSYSQQNRELEVRQTIERFFEGFHNRDSTVMRSVLAPNPILQTIGQNAEGKTGVRDVPFDALIKAIVSIPDSVAFEERIKSYNIRIDGPMANAWTAYEFWRNNTFSHCGVNSFQLYHDGSSWKILYLIDTRRIENCPQYRANPPFSYRKTIAINDRLCQGIMTSCQFCCIGILFVVSMAACAMSTAPITNLKEAK